MCRYSLDNIVCPLTHVQMILKCKDLTWKNRKEPKTSWGWAVPSSAQLKLAVNYLVARLLILTQLACADTTYYTQFSLKAKLQLKNKLLRVGGWVGGWVGLLEKWRIRLSQPNQLSWSWIELGWAWQLIGVNANGLKSKLSTFKKVIFDLQPALFFIQESKYQTKGRFKIENFQIFIINLKR